MKRPFAVYVLLFLHLFLGLGAATGGLLLMLRPDGSLLQMQPGWLNDTVFVNYFIPGFLLFTFLGALSILTLTGIFIKPDFAWTRALNLYPGKHWSWAFSIYTGISSITWITVQLVMTQYFWIQPVIIFNGLLILAFTLLPGTMNYLSLNKK